MKFLPTEAITYIVFCDYFLGAQILNVHDFIKSNNSGTAKVKIVKKERDPPLFTS
jgi:hypothetical protein